MATCRSCGKKSLFITVNARGICSQCDSILVEQVKQVDENVTTILGQIDEAEALDQKIFGFDLVIQRFKVVKSNWEDKGIQSLDPPPSHLIVEYKNQRAETIFEHIYQQLEDAQSEAEKGTTLQERAGPFIKLHEKVAEYDHLLDDPTALDTFRSMALLAAATATTKHFTAEGDRLAQERNPERAIETYLEGLEAIRTDRVKDEFQQDEIEELSQRIRDLGGEVPDPTLPRSETDPPKKSNRKGTGQKKGTEGKSTKRRRTRHSVLKDGPLQAVLDEETCLECLELDGSSEYPQPPIHDGCRCKATLVTKSWEELGFKGLREIGSKTRASALGPIGADGGIYKAYLILRARALRSGLADTELTTHLAQSFSELEEQFSSDKTGIATLRAELLLKSPTRDDQSLEASLSGLPWNSPSVERLLPVCAELERYDLLEAALARMVSEVPAGEYRDRHAGMLYRDAAKAVKKHSLEKCIIYIERAAELDRKNTAILVDLGKLYRRVDRVEDARRVLEEALLLKPQLKSAKNELAKVTR